MTEVQTETKLFAQFKTASYMPGEVLEIKDVQEAVDHGIKNNARSFRTYEVTSVTLNGKALTGEPENLSGTYHLGVDKLVTAADVVAKYDAWIAQENPRSPEGEDMLQFLLQPSKNEDYYAPRPHVDPAELHEVVRACVNRQMRDNFSQYSPEAPYFEVNREYTGIASNDKVYNTQGQQIYPKPSAVAVRARPSAGPRP